MDDAFVKWDTASTYMGMYVSACVIVYILHSVISSPVSPLAKSDLATHKQIFDCFQFRISTLFTAKQTKAASFEPLEVKPYE